MIHLLACVTKYLVNKYQLLAGVTKYLVRKYFLPGKIHMCNFHISGNLVAAIVSKTCMVLVA
jgi:hypothetical protein